VTSAPNASLVSSCGQAMLHVLAHVGMRSICRKRSYCRQGCSTHKHKCETTHTHTHTHTGARVGDSRQRCGSDLLLKKAKGHAAETTEPWRGRRCFRLEWICLLVFGGGDERMGDSAAPEAVCECECVCVSGCDVAVAKMMCSCRVGWCKTCRGRHSPTRRAGSTASTISRSLAVN
jgi:hypothetical protein